MKIYTYKLQDGRTVLSPEDLSYAMLRRSNTIIDLAQVRPEHNAKLSIVAGEQAADCLRLMLAGGAWEDPTQAMTHADTTCYARNYCIMLDGKVYINDGGYIPLSQFLLTATEQQKNYVLTQIAQQAALAQIELAKLTSAETA